MASNFIDLIGQRFSRLLVTEFVGSNKKRQALWRCKCDCGGERITSGVQLRNGGAKSCGCLQKEIASKLAIARTIHGKTLTRTYRIWGGIIKRCTNPNSKNWVVYGGRGIKICDRWLNSFQNFYQDMGDPPSSEYSIDRIDNDGNYEPNNCRWATRKQQSRNTSRNLQLTFKGETKILIEWAEATGIPSGALQIRIVKLGWTVEKALTTPLRKRRVKPHNQDH